MMNNSFEALNGSFDRADSGATPHPKKQRKSKASTSLADSSDNDTIDILTTVEGRSISATSALSPQASLVEPTMTRSRSFDQLVSEALSPASSGQLHLHLPVSPITEALNLSGIEDLSALHTTTGGNITGLDSPTYKKLSTPLLGAPATTHVVHNNTAAVPSTTGRIAIRSKSDLGALIQGSPAIPLSKATAMDAIHESGSPHAVPAGTATRSTGVVVTPANWVPPAPQPPSAQPLAEYVAAELLPGPSYATTETVWGQTERDRVYNAVTAVPFQLERLMWYGMMLCLDSFLAMFTLLPIRVCVAIFTLIYKKSSSGNVNTTEQQQQQQHRLRGDQLYDFICALLFVVSVTFLWNLRAGAIYFWVKDLTQEFLKISVLQTALELTDKICCSFGVDMLVALAASCTHAAGAGRGTFKAWYNLICDTTMTAVLVSIHSAALMSQAIVFSVAMNSRKNTLIALLIASNFTEIKGTVLKRFDSTRIYLLACQDVVELFHLLLILIFVAVEEAAGAGRFTPSRHIITQCGYVFVAELVIDVMKHAVLVKFNDIRPGVYREFLRDLCDKVTVSQSHTVHRLVGLEPFAPCALFLRLAATFWFLMHDNDGGDYSSPGLFTALFGSASGGSTLRIITLIAGYAAIWAGLVAFKVLLGYLVKRAAVSYVRQYDLSSSSRLRRGQPRATAVSTATVAAGTKKDE